MSANKESIKRHRNSALGNGVLIGFGVAICLVALYALYFIEELKRRVLPPEVAGFLQIPQLYYLFILGLIVLFTGIIIEVYKRGKISSKSG